MATIRYIVLTGIAGAILSACAGSGLLHDSEDAIPPGAEPSVACGDADTGEAAAVWHAPGAGLYARRLSPLESVRAIRLGDAAWTPKITAVGGHGWVITWYDSDTAQLLGQLWSQNLSGGGPAVILSDAALSPTRYASLSEVADRVYYDVAYDQVSDRVMIAWSAFADGTYKIFITVVRPQSASELTLAVEHGDRTIASVSEAITDIAAASGFGDEPFAVAFIVGDSQVRATKVRLRDLGPIAGSAGPIAAADGQVESVAIVANPEELAHLIVYSRAGGDRPGIHFYRWEDSVLTAVLDPTEEIQRLVVTPNRHVPGYGRYPLGLSLAYRADRRDRAHPFTLFYFDVIADPFAGMRDSAALFGISLPADGVPPGSTRRASEPQVAEVDSCAEGTRLWNVFAKAPRETSLEDRVAYRVYWQLIPEP